MNKLNTKGKIAVVAIIVVIIILVIVGIKYLPVWSTIESILLFIAGFFFGWFVRSRKPIKEKLSHEVED